MDGPLVDAEGFPRADIDLYQVRTARHSIACEWGRAVRRWLWAGSGVRVSSGCEEGLRKNLSLKGRCVGGVGLCSRVTAGGREATDWHCAGVEAGWIRFLSQRAAQGGGGVTRAVEELWEHGTEGRGEWARWVVVVRVGPFQPSWCYDSASY